MAEKLQAKVGDIELAEQLKLLFGFISTLNVDRLKEFKQELENQVSNYEAIGILDGHNYFRKLDDMQARHKRIISLINLIDIFKETQNKII